ncbi:hypothetical protein F8S09_14765 [Deinococcus sp. SDU3-2]|uniref:Secreted protein n=1 Tax=Deinococcus terrestris TaxID=2651870 RepID=A0A7X1NY28_9DEIO|nr:hypothetical protein [Deinococcus terrestris]MPY67922.1 hypothetical protein [Deinococcus terrestris]
MKTKALLLSALILVPSAGAAAVQAAPTQDFRVQTGKALAAPAQDFRVSYTSTALNTTPTIFAKSNLPQALNDEELDEVTGEGGPVSISTLGAAGGIIGGVGAAVNEGAKALSNYVKTGETKTTWSEVGTNVGAGILGGIATGVVGGLIAPFF